jgi:secreted Zn-dependent insulinase-like peptidase
MNIGNKQSLMRDNDCGALREKVLKFHRQNYHGTKMKLVVIGGGKYLCVIKYLVYLLVYKIMCTLDVQNKQNKT